jgi:hypothetical protein
VIGTVSGLGFGQQEERAASTSKDATNGERCQERCQARHDVVVRECARTSLLLSRRDHPVQLPKIHPISPIIHPTQGASIWRVGHDVAEYLSVAQRSAPLNKLASRHG